MGIYLCVVAGVSPYPDHRYLTKAHYTSNAFLLLHNIHLSKGWFLQAWISFIHRINVSLLKLVTTIRLLYAAQIFYSYLISIWFFARCWKNAWKMAPSQSPFPRLQNLILELLCAASNKQGGTQTLLPTPVCNEKGLHWLVMQGCCAIYI